ncbi:branched-chain amino acid transport system II carrier protein [Holzapfeliella floricola]|uniref:Branched-chain amino acid transport system carrier protein n=1 Tax=Holzapfeliella floricola DSM 23037 = JCM 16512 TaxID=1423744 RepID=A0A0R2DJ41_9LACO|nr:branched-chain amino acid transport system II carrier protein [Holzapfeliella floricola]KRN04112.1 branched-chain amino acid transport protein [Holzapfeliella floricola DSM 23037 = JCM 16512]
MKTNHLSLKNTIYIGLLLFGVFFGAGNVIFPISLGQQSGNLLPLSTAGFLVTSVGFSLLGVLSVNFIKENSVFEIANKVSKPYAYVFTILIFLILGPLFITPRLATTSFDVGIQPLISAGSEKWVLAIFSILFFTLTFVLTLKPAKLMTYVGKYLTPLFLILMGILILFAFMNPMGDLNHTAQPAYQSHTFFTGFLQGYNTMDALGAQLMAFIVIDAIKELGITDSKQIAKELTKSSVIFIILMSVIYILLALMGGLSLGQLAPASNGGIALAQIATHYFGKLGNVLLAAIIIVACLKTAIGLITAFGETMNNLFPKVSYRTFVIIACIAPALFANIGLTNIISYSVPVLMFMFPLALVLIIVALLTPLVGDHNILYQTTTLFVLIPAIMDGLNNLPQFLANETITRIIESYHALIPFSSIGLGWVIPAVVGYIIGMILLKLNPTKKSKA